MMPPTVNIHEAKTHLSRLLDRVRQGETVIIAKAGEPIAQLTAYQHPPRIIGSLDHLEWDVTDEEWDESDRVTNEIWGEWLDDPVEFD